MTIPEIGVRVGVIGSAGAASSLAAVGAAAKKAGGDTEQGMSAARRGIVSVSQQLESLANAAKAYIGLQLVANVAADLARQSHAAAVAMESMSRTLQYASGSARDFVSNSEFLRDRVATLGLDLLSAGAAFAKVAAAAKGTALEGEGARSIFDAVSKASTVMGLNAETTAGALLAVNQMISRGTVSAEELRGQLGERLPGAFQSAARAMGVTTKELGKMLEQGQLLSDVFLPRFAAQLRRDLGESVALAADSVQANTNRMKTAWTRLLVGINNSTFTNESIKGLVMALEGVDKALKTDKGEWSDWAPTVARSIAWVADLGNNLLATVRGVKREFVGIYETANLYLERQAVLMALGQGLGKAGATKQSVNAEYDARQKAMDAGYERDVAAIYAGIGKFQQAVEAEIAARAERQRRLALDRRAREALREGDGVQAFRDEELLASAPKLGDDAEALKRRAEQYAVLLVRTKESVAAIALKVREEAAEIESGLKLSDAEKYALGLMEQVAAGKLKIADLIRNGTMASVQQSIAEAEASRVSKDGSEARTKALAEEQKARDKAFESLASHTAEIVEDTERQLESNIAMALGDEALKRLEISKLNDAAATALRRAVEEESRDGDLALAARWREQAAALEGLAAAKKAGIGAAAAKTAREDWAKAADSIEQSLTDALMRGFESGRGFAESLKSTLISTFKTMVLKPTIQAQVKGLGGMLQQSGIGQAFRAGWGGADYASAYNGSTYNTQPGSSQSRMLAEQDAGMGTATVGFAAAGAAGSTVRATAPYVGMMVAIGSAVRREVSQGFDAHSARNSYLGGGGLGPGAAAAELSNLGEKLGMSKWFSTMLSGAHIIARAVGKASPTIRAQGLTGEFGGGAFSGQAFADINKKGGWLRSDDNWTESKAMDPALAHGLDESAKALLDKTRDYAKSLALPVDALTTVTAAARVELGADEEANKQAIAKALGGYGDALADTFKAQLAKYARAWETTAQALERLAGLQQFSDNLNALGGVFSRVALLGVDARESMIALAGGMDAFKTQALGYVQNYFNRDEIAGGKAREVRETLVGAGITQDISTREQFRGLVDNAAVDTDAGRRQLAALMGVQGDFAQVADFIAENGGTLGSTSKLAPDMGALASLFETGASAQVDATNGVRDAVVDQTAALVAVLERIAEGNPEVGFVGGNGPWEVNPTGGGL